MAKNVRSGSSLEREVITSVIALYVLICLGLLLVHYLQPAGQATDTSSTSPSHAMATAIDGSGPIRLR